MRKSSPASSLDSMTERQGELTENQLLLVQESREKIAEERQLIAEHRALVSDQHRKTEMEIELLNHKLAQRGIQQNLATADCSGFMENLRGNILDISGEDLDRTSSNIISPINY